jgi:hypothetical protein
MVSASERLEAVMSAASDRMGAKSAGPVPRRKAAQISPELAEVLRMLKALEERSDTDRDDGTG